MTSGAVSGAIWDACRPGRAEYEVVADVEAFFRDEGCPDNFMIMGSGGQEVRGMTPAGERRLQPGDLVTTELTPCVDGYYAQLCRTLVIGEPSKAQLSAHDVYLEAEAAGVGGMPDTQRVLVAATHDGAVVAMNAPSKTTEAIHPQVIEAILILEQVWGSRPVERSPVPHVFRYKKSYGKNSHCNGNYKISALPV